MKILRFKFRAVTRGMLGAKVPHTDQLMQDYYKRSWSLLLFLPFLSSLISVLNLYRYP
jgi:hypothetical protein